VGKEVGHFIKEWRMYKGLSQGELAKMAGMSAPAVSMLESGGSKYTQRTLEPIAKALGEKPGTLIDLHPDEIDYQYESNFIADLRSILRRIEPLDRPLVLELMRAVARHKPPIERKGLARLMEFGNEL
jgi:transcriptional regulator with XRE-family HTH domain